MVDLNQTLSAISSWMQHKLNICVSQGSAATELRRGGRFKSDFVRHFFLDATLKEFLKFPARPCQSYHKNKSGTFFYGSQYSMYSAPTPRAGKTCLFSVSRRVPLNSFYPGLIPVGQAHRWHFRKTYIVYFIPR